MTDAAAASAPRFSFVTAVYDVARYLPDYIRSIEAQTFPLERVEVIAVDDGSTDDSLQVLRDWAARRPELVTVLHKDNGGQGSARNLGIEHAHGEWVTFLDPDDLVDPDYLDTVERCLTADPDVTLAATNRVFLDDATGETSDTHPLRRMFADGDRVVDLALSPEHFHGSAPAAFLRRDVLQSAGIRFDDRIRPNFEDGEFCSRYLLAAGTSHVAFLQSARYLYRKRADGTSTLQNSLLDPARFTDVPRHGYLALLRDAIPSGGGFAPEWLQHFVLYELAGYFKADTAMSMSATAATGEVGHAFVQVLREIAQYLDPAVVATTDIAKFDPVWREVLLHLGDESWVTPFGSVTAYDRVKGQTRVVYRYRGRQPAETFVVGGAVVDPVVVKTRSLAFFGETLLHERIAWLPPGGTLRLLLDGTAVPLHHDTPDAGRTTLAERTVRGWFREKYSRRSPEDELIVRLARSRAGQRFRNAWVVMDRVPAADDNGERLFRYLREHRPDINAWFVLDENCADWKRLKADGVDRLVAYGSRRWKLLMLNCAHLIASHTEPAVRRPPEILRLLAPAKPTWTFTFLQHGVIKDDLSRWLNPKPIDVFVTSTRGEYDSIAGDGSPYSFTAKEVVLSGLPRFDRLRQVAERTPERDLVLVCPTWRIWLSPREDVLEERTIVADFAETEYARQWLGVLTDETLRDALAAQGLTLAFMPHPNIQPVLSQLRLPPWVEAITYAGNDVQQLVARGALMITDYSSMAFNAGYLDRPVVYFQFDAKRVFSGGHVGVKGYFDYERDGFGPVTSTVAQTVAAVAGIVAAPGRSPGEPYVDRFARTFPDRDGRCCERVVAAVEALTARD